MNIELIQTLDTRWSTAHPKRITRKQKERFLDELDHELQVRGFATERIGVRSLLFNRLLVTQCERPRVIFMAHYDTATTMPFWLSWLYRVFGHTRQILMSLILIAGILAAYALLDSISRSGELAFYALMVVAFIPLLMPNPHNREDNTSGVIGLLALADWVKDQPALREQVQFVFLDNEENGLLGSMGLQELWTRQKHPYREAAIINLDCISRGRIPLLVYHGKSQLAQRVKPYLEKNLPGLKLMNMGPVPLSDNYTFRSQGAVDITYTDPSLVPGGYYVPRIHDPRDNDLSPEQLQACVAGLTEFIEDEYIRSPDDASSG